MVYTWRSVSDGGARARVSRAVLRASAEKTRERVARETFSQDYSLDEFKADNQKARYVAERARGVQVPLEFESGRDESRGGGRI